MSKMILKRGLNRPYYFLQGSVDPVIFRAIKKALTYVPTVIEKSAKRNAKVQNDVEFVEECLLCKTPEGAWYFPVGLLPRVLEILNYAGIDYAVVNDVELPGEPLGLKWCSDKELYDYQRKAAEIAYMNSGGTITLPTGGGKSLIGLRLIYAFDHRSLILVNSRELMKQWRGHIRDTFDIDPGLVGGQFKESWDDITVASVQTLARRVKNNELDKIDFDYPVCLCDEVHHVPANDAYSVAMKYNSPVRIGLSATPRRTDGQEMRIWGAIGDICARITAVDLIKMGYLTKPRFVILDPPYVKLRNTKKWHEIYFDGIVANPHRNALIVHAVRKLVDSGNQVYVHVERVEHGEVLECMFDDVQFIHGSTPKKQRDEVIGKFASGESRCLISTLLGEGVDIPKMDAIIMAGGMKTPIGVVQKVGRVLRLSPGKEEALIVDFRDKGGILARHFQERMDIYRETYGEFVDNRGDL